MVERCREGGFAYFSNVSPPSFPDGLDCEIISFGALEAADREAREPHEREHVTPFVSERPARFPRGNHTCPFGDFSDIHWSVDHPEDLALVEEVLAAADKSDPRLPDLVNVLAERPDLAARSRARRIVAAGIKTFLASLELRPPRPSIPRSSRRCSYQPRSARSSASCILLGSSCPRASPAWSPVLSWCGPGRTPRTRPVLAPEPPGPRPVGSACCAAATMLGRTGPSTR